MVKVVGPLFGTAATGRIGDSGTFRTSASGAQFIAAPSGKKKKKKPKLPKPEEPGIKALDATGITPMGTRTAIYPADRVTTTSPPVSIIDVSEPSHGTASVEYDTVIYTPEAGFIGTDTMIYTAQDAAGRQAEAKIRVKVIAIKGKARKPKAKRPPTEKEEWIREQMKIARKQWAKLPRQKRVESDFSHFWRIRYFRDPNWPTFWNQWLIDHPFEG